MSSKRPRIKRASNEPIEDYDHMKFISLPTSRRYTALAKNKNFIKEKGVESPNDFFRMATTNKGWKDLCIAPMSKVKEVVREFYGNLCAKEEMKVWVRDKWVPFDSETINRFYNLPSVNDEDYQTLLEKPNYAEIITSLTKERQTQRAME